MLENTSHKTKYIFVSGGLISGIGKGTTAASIALLLKAAGYKIAPIKFENYLNVDAGTINPIEHGDPFLCEDGTEADMDIGTYEKFLDEDMGNSNFVTMGRIYQTVIDKERRFEYHGEDVEAIPHITDEITRRIKHVASEKKADIVIIELGGTAGEYQNIFYYEASRIMTLKYPGDVVHVHVSYVPTPAHLGEPKTKPTQLSVRTLNSMGIQPDFIVARSEKYLDQRRRDRFALFCNMHEGDIISNPDLTSPYEIPGVLQKQELDKKILEKLHLKPKTANIVDWEKLVEKIKKPKLKEMEIVIVGKYFGTGDYQLRDSYAALFDAIDHAAWKIGVGVKTRWVAAEKIEKDGPEKHIGNPAGIIVPIGWGERGAEGMIQAASYARTRKIPYLGLCYGMQLAVVAFARDVLGWKDADTAENDEKTVHPVIHIIESQKELIAKRAYGGTMRLGKWDAIIQKGTLAFEYYEKYGGPINTKTGLTSERHRHRYEFNNKFAKDFEKAGLVISARSVVESLVEIIELPKSMHPFYMGTQGHPEYKSRPLKPHPLFVAFIEACKEQKG
ncbi:MAG TPA: CTP synthase [Candidatus Saccharimonadales bacterium]|nr:CTP synthase [Candidatus Saccharimonadales bacterium]